MPRKRPTPDPALAAEARNIAARMRHAVETGEAGWFDALLAAVRAWPLAEEDAGGRTYRYLVAGEAFDWLLLAERLLGEIEDLVPEDEAAALLFHGHTPWDLEEDDLRQLLGAKYRAHLNYVYGVHVEQALQLAVLRDVRKERLSRVWDNGHTEDEAFTRIYGGTRPALLAEWRAAAAPRRRKTRAPASRPRTALIAPANDPTGDDPLSLADLPEFTYWLFRRRVNGHDPARVASDTRKGMATFQELDALRRRGAPVAIESA
jgi:hypothetical protein